MSLEKYKVLDLIEDLSKINVLLVLESPHINEYIHGHPVAGKSGDKLTNLFKLNGYLCDFDGEIPLGCNIKRKKYPFLGVVNCSLLPMDKAFYPCVLSDKDSIMIDSLMSIKDRLEIRVQKSYKPKLQSERDVFNDFSTRLTKVIENSSAENLIIIPCGCLATNFVNTFKKEYFNDLIVLKGVPHPSAPNWYTKIKKLTIWDKISKELLP